MTFLIQIVALLLSALCVWQLWLWWLPVSHNAYAPVASFANDSAYPSASVPSALSASFNTITTPAPVAKTIAAPKPKVQEVMTVANVNIKVDGIVMLPVAAKSRAILSVQGNASKVYRIGDELQRQMVLTKIKSKSLIVERDGNTIELLFKQPKEAAAQPPSKASVGNASVTSASSAGEEQHSGANIVISQQLKDVLMKNPIQATQYILAAPEFRNGKMHGYRLRKGKNSEAFDASGFQEGDVLTHIGENHVSQISAGQLLGGGLLSQTTISIVLEREGVSMALDVQIQ